RPARSHAARVYTPRLPAPPPVTMPISHRHHARCGACADSHVDADYAEAAAAGARPFAFSSTARQFERDRPFLVQHIAVDLTLEVADKSVSGTATLDFERVDPTADAVQIDAVGFAIRDVKVDGKNAKYSYDGRVITVPLGSDVKSAKVAVTYRATP